MKIGNQSSLLRFRNPSYLSSSSTYRRRILIQTLLPLILCQRSSTRYHRFELSISFHLYQYWVVTSHPVWWSRLVCSDFSFVWLLSLPLVSLKGISNLPASFLYTVNHVNHASLSMPKRVDAAHLYDSLISVRESKLSTSSYFPLRSSA